MLPTHRKPTLPGKILLEEFLLPLCLSESEFVRHLGGTWTVAKLSAIISGKKAINEQAALDLADALGTSPEFWIGLQSDIHLWEAAQTRKKIPRIKRRKILANRPQVRRKSVRVSVD